MTFKLEFVVVESNFDYYADMFVETKRLTQAARTAEWHEETLKQFRAVMGEDWPPQPRHLLAFLRNSRIESWPNIPKTITGDQCEPG